MDPQQPLIDYFNAGEFEKAEEYAPTIINKNPNDYESYVCYALAMCLNSSKVFKSEQIEAMIAKAKSFTNCKEKMITYIEKRSAVKYLNFFFSNLENNNFFDDNTGYNLQFMDLYLKKINKYNTEFSNSFFRNVGIYIANYGNSFEDNIKEYEDIYSKYTKDHEVKDFDKLQCQCKILLQHSQTILKMIPFCVNVTNYAKLLQAANGVYYAVLILPLFVNIEFKLVKDETGTYTLETCTYKKNDLSYSQEIFDLQKALNSSIYDLFFAFIKNTNLDFTNLTDSEKKLAEGIKKIKSLDFSSFSEIELKYPLYILDKLLRSDD